MTEVDPAVVPGASFVVSPEDATQQTIESQHTRGLASMWVAVGVIAAMTLAGFFVPLPHDPIKPSNDLLEPPSLNNYFGTDSLGYDVFSRTVWAARQDIPLALAGTAASLVLGVTLGLLASRKGRGPELIMRGLDVFQAFPLVILAIAIVTLLGNRLSNVVVAIAIINVPRFMRLIRSEALTVRETRYIEAAMSIGASPMRVMVRHMLPNVTTPILVQSALTGANALMVIATMNFLGIGVSPPFPTWGGMIQDGSRFIGTGQWWLFLFPSIAIFVVVFALNYIADSLYQRIDDRRIR